VARLRRILVVETVQDHNRRQKANPAGIIDALAAKLLSVRNSGNQRYRKTRVRRLIESPNRDHVTDIKFLMDTEIDVSTLSQDAIVLTLTRYSMLQTKQSSPHMDKNYSSLIWDSVVFFNSLL